ncbi:MAG: glycosyltransferase family 39 protein, partial [Anaerolineae bacterium]
MPAALLAAGFFLSALAVLLAGDRPLDAAPGDAVVPWLLGMAAVAAAALWNSAPVHQFAARLRRPRSGSGSHPSSTGDSHASSRTLQRDWWLELATIAGLTLLALLLRVAALDRVPFTIGGDEAWHGLLARQVLHGELRNPFNMGYMSMPTGFYWPLSWSMWLIGQGVVGLRLPAVLVGTATVPLLYLFARDLWGRRTATLAAAFLAGYDYHIHYSRLGANNVWDPLFVLVVLWMVDRGLGALREDRAGDGAYRWFLIGGLVMGLSLYFYTGARLLPLLVGSYAAFVWLRGALDGKAPRARTIAWGLVLVTVAFLIAAGPMLSYALSHPDQWNARINQVGILQSGWLEREPGLTGKTTARILAEQFLHAAGAFHVFADRTVWYGADRPLLGFLPGILALLGMAWAIARWRQRRYFLLLLWFWAAIVTGGMLTESPPSSQRLVIAIPTIALLVAVGLERIVRLASRILALDRRWERAILALLVVISVVGSVHYYFAEFTPQRRYGSENGETATMIGYYLRDLVQHGEDYHVYFFGAPQIYWSFGTMTFLAPSVTGEDVVEPLRAPPDFVQAGGDALFVLLPHRAGEL